jgi:hypothetical protein
VRGIPSPFINLDERGRDTPHPSLLPLLPRKDFIDEILACVRTQCASIYPVGRRSPFKVVIRRTALRKLAAPKLFPIVNEYPMDERGQPND